jgi:hypothetical protein
VGYVDVYRNGVYLPSADYTATTGTTVVLANAATAGDTITTISFYVSSVLNAIPATSASIQQSYLASGVAGTGPAFSAYLSSSQAIATATYTKVQLNIKEFDTNNAFDNATNYRFQPNIAGYYLISGCLYFNIAPVTLSNGSLHIYKNGSTFKFVNLDANSGNGHYGSTVTSVIYLNGSTDYIELYVYQNNGSSQNIVGQSNATYLSGVMVRSA